MPNLGHWKTTVQSTLTGIIALPALAMTPQLAPVLSVKVTGYISLAAIAAKFALGFFQKDAGVQDVALPDGKTATEPSHEVPDDPKAVITK